MKKFKRFNFITNAVCNLNCEFCSKMSLMDNYQYNLSASEIKKVLDVFEKSDYFFFDIILSGGEPTIWKNLEEGISILRASKSLRSIYVITNGANWKRLIPFKDHVITKLSKYDFNVKMIPEMRKELGRRLTIYDQRHFYPIPTSVLDLGEEPKTGWPCSCAGYAYFNNKLYSCSNMPDLLCRFPNMANYDDVCVDLQPNFVEKFHRSQPVCRGCISNPMVRKIMGRVKNKNLPRTGKVRLPAIGDAQPTGMNNPKNKVNKKKHEDNYMKKLRSLR